MNVQQVENAIGKAQKMMSEDYQRQIVNAERRRTGKKSISGSNDLALLEQQAFGYSTQTSQQIPNMQQRQAMQAQTENAIRESFAQMPALSGSNFPNDGSYGYQPGQSLINEQRAYQQPVYQQPVYQQMPQMGGVDYNMLKMIVNECIRENLEGIRQSLNETTIRGMRMSGGNKIQFLDTKGNLYEGVLSLKKKA